MAGKKIDKKSMSRVSGGNTVAGSQGDIKNAKAIVKEELKKEALAKAQGAGMARHTVTPTGRVRPAIVNPKTGAADGQPTGLPICTGTPEE